MRLKRVFGNTPHAGYAWALIAIAALSVLSAWTYDRFFLLQTSVLQARPGFILSVVILGLWGVAWAASLKHRAVHWLLASATFAVTAFGPLRWLSMWGCVTGACEW